MIDPYKGIGMRLNPPPLSVAAGAPDVGRTLQSMGQAIIDLQRQRFNLPAPASGRVPVSYYVGLASGLTIAAGASIDPVVWSDVAASGDVSQSGGTITISSPDDPTGLGTGPIYIAHLALEASTVGGVALTGGERLMAFVNPSTPPGAIAHVLAAGAPGATAQLYGTCDCFVGRAGFGTNEVRLINVGTVDLTIVVAEIQLFRVI